MRVIEQKQALETDRHGNIWLALSVLDISPVQEPLDAVKSQLFNFKTGEIRLLPAAVHDASRPDIALTPREKQVLQLVRDGYLSKEISEQMAISVHTVNTYIKRAYKALRDKLGASLLLFMMMPESPVPKPANDKNGK